jgi:hypothetical protein
MPDVVPALGHSLGTSRPRFVAVINRYMYRPRRLRIADRLSNQRQRCILVRTVCCTRMTLDDFGYHYDLISPSDIPETLWSVSGSSSALSACSQALQLQSEFPCGYALRDICKMASREIFVECVECELATLSASSHMFDMTCILKRPGA